MTVAFFQYLEDMREQTARDIAIDIAEGINVPQKHIEQLTASCGVFVMVENAEYSDIEEFYSEVAQSKMEEENE